MYVAGALPLPQDTLYAGHYRNVRQAVAARNALAFVLMAQKKKKEKRTTNDDNGGNVNINIHITKPFSLSLDLSFSQADTDIGADRGRDRDNVHLVFAFKKKNPRGRQLKGRPFKNGGLALEMGKTTYRTCSPKKGK